MLDFVYVIEGGRIIKIGIKELVLELEEKGYDDVVEVVKVGV